MAFLFRSKSKSPQELIKVANEAFDVLEKKKESAKREKAVEDLSKILADIKKTLFGDDQTEPNPEHCAQLANEAHATDFLLHMVLLIEDLEFESRKDATQIFTNLVRRQVGTRSTVDYIQRHTAILDHLVDEYQTPEVCITCGTMLREALRHESLCRHVLFSDKFYKFFAFVDLENFDVASDAFASFKEILTRHKGLSAEYLEANFDKFFESYTKLLSSDNYVTRRQSLKLLGELLLDRANFNVMTRYISLPENLKLMMNLLKDKHRNIQFEAFHVFKVFVANPHKPKPIKDILLKNQEKLVMYLSSFHNDKVDDEQFNDEKALLIREISGLQPDA